jgi:hypothetical protein
VAGGFGIPLASVLVPTLCEKIMSKKNHAPGPVPPDNRAKGPASNADPAQEDADQDGTGFQEQDPKRRLGDFTGTGEHSLQQPGGKNGSDGRRSRGSDD